MALMASRQTKNVGIMGRQKHNGFPTPINDVDLEVVIELAKLAIEDLLTTRTSKTSRLDSRHLECRQRDLSLCSWAQ